MEREIHWWTKDNLYSDGLNTAVNYKRIRIVEVRVRQYVESICSPPKSSPPKTGITKEAISFKYIDAATNSNMEQKNRKRQNEQKQQQRW